MAKPDLRKQLEDAIRQAVNEVADRNQSVPEARWCEALADVLDVELTGANMRLEELIDEEEEG